MEFGLHHYISFSSIKSIWYSPKSCIYSAPFSLSLLSVTDLLLKYKPFLFPVFAVNLESPAKFLSHSRELPLATLIILANPWFYENLPPIHFPFLYCTLHNLFDVLLFCSFIFFLALIRALETIKQNQSWLDFHLHDCTLPTLMT